MRYIVQGLVVFLVSMFLVACSSEEGADTGAAAKAKPSPTVEQAFDEFNAYDFATGSDDEIIANVKSTLQSPQAGDVSPDIQTALAIVQLFEITKEPLIKGLVNISIENYENIVSDVLKQFSENRFSFAFGEGISQSAPQTAHKTALSFKDISDKLNNSFSSKSYVFNYWGEDGLDYDKAQAIRVVLLGVASQLELISTYDFGSDECYLTKNENSIDYLEVQVDPANVLNGDVCGDVLVFRDSNEARSRLANGKIYLLEALELAKDIDTTDLPTNKSFTAKDYKTYQKYIPDLIDNLTSKETKSKISIDAGLGFPIVMTIDIRSIFEPATIIDVNDIRQMGYNNFVYVCDKKGDTYSKAQSIEAQRPMCEQSRANLWLDKAPDVVRSNIDEFVLKARWTLFSFEGQDLVDNVMKELKPKQR